MKKIKEINETKETKEIKETEENPEVKEIFEESELETAKIVMPVQDYSVEFTALQETINAGTFSYPGELEEAKESLTKELTRVTTEIFEKMKDQDKFEIKKFEKKEPEAVEVNKEKMN